MEHTEGKLSVGISVLFSSFFGCMIASSKGNKVGKKVKISFARWFLSFFDGKYGTQQKSTLIQIDG